MNRFATITEDIQRINNMAGIGVTPPVNVKEDNAPQWYVGLPVEFAKKQTFTRKEVLLILESLKKRLDERGQYVVGDFYQFLGFMTPNGQDFMSSTDINETDTVVAKPPCGCDKPDQGREIITSAPMGESTDQDKYEDVVFMQGDEANEPLHILDTEGEDAALEYLKTWHMLGSHMGSQRMAHGESDLTYRKDGYIMSWNPHLGYIGLQYDLQQGEDSRRNAGMGADTVAESADPKLQRMIEINKFLLRG